MASPLFRRLVSVQLRVLLVFFFCVCIRAVEDHVLFALRRARDETPLCHLLHNHDQKTLTVVALTSTLEPTPPLVIST